MGPVTSIRNLLLLVAATVLVASPALAHPTVYMKRQADDTLAPVLVPVSSTVVPLPIYKVGYSVGTGSGKKLYDPDVKLITVKTKNKAKVGANVKSISREDFEKDVTSL